MDIEKYFSVISITWMTFEKNKEEIEEEVKI
jgi:hypothetical protein